MVERSDRRQRRCGREEAMGGRQQLDVHHWRMQDAEDGIMTAQGAPEKCAACSCRLGANTQCSCVSFERCVQPCHAST